jgi:hypothetical protein
MRLSIEVCHRRECERELEFLVSLNVEIVNASRLIAYHKRFW